jgi:hypothetical protein
VRVWYFFLATGVLGVACVFFFFAFAIWSSGRTDSNAVPRPKLVTLDIVAGMALTGLCLWILSL